MRKSYLKYIIFSVTSISIDFGYQSILIGELNRWIRPISDIDFYRLTTSAILIFRLSDSRNAEEKFTKKKQRFPRVRSPLTPLTAALFHLNAWNELISWKHPRLFHMKLPPGGGSYVPLLLMSKVNFLFFDSKAVALEMQKLSCLILYLTVWKQYASTIGEDIRKQKSALLDLNHSHITR